jgi:hypothetical protein
VPVTGHPNNLVRLGIHTVVGTIVGDSPLPLSPGEQASHDRRQVSKQAVAASQTELLTASVDGIREATGVGKTLQYVASRPGYVVFPTI